ncbi:hypothetical protein L2E82_00687 [Cichorium intybus]|uniref:Uncharacterized protein n=1 Tax=Cichorium intybus TaxID=13427 RepID=A0ACB9GX32_CICIN|nr:hypothetical protein L2E82_00687 [Cichorium intybus]
MELSDATMIRGVATSMLARVLTQLLLEMLETALLNHNTAEEVIRSLSKRAQIYNPPSKRTASNERNHNPHDHTRRSSSFSEFSSTHF